MRITDPQLPIPFGNEWSGKAGRIWVHRSLTPPAPAIAKAHRTVVADEDGKFQFSELPPGRYYVRAETTWKVANYNSVQGGPSKVAG